MTPWSRSVKFRFPFQRPLPLQIYQAQFDLFKIPGTLQGARAPRPPVRGHGSHSGCSGAGRGDSEAVGSRACQSALSPALTPPRPGS